MTVCAAPRRAGALAMLGAAVALALAAVRSDAGGALLCLPLVGVAGALGLRDLLLVPALRADGEGLRVRPHLGLHEVPWREVATVRVLRDRRAVLLEVGLVDESVLLLSRLRLGRDPQGVLEELERVRPR